MILEAFGQIPWHKFSSTREEEIKTEILSKGKDYILKVDETEYKEYLENIFHLEPLRILTDTESIAEPVKLKASSKDSFGRNLNREQYLFTVSYIYEGSSVLFRVIPSTHYPSNIKIDLFENTNKVTFKIELFNLNPQEFKNLKQSNYNNAFSNIDFLNIDIAKWNNALKIKVERTFNSIKSNYLEENSFFEAINVKVDKNTESIFTPPILKKTKIPQPKIDQGKEFKSVPSMSIKMYEGVLRILYDAGKNMERKPALYIGKDEEGLRDQFLFILETRYVGVTATGETFNRRGKTDILLKYANDGSNLFIAECKFWHGKIEYFKAIDQLFENYLSWGDSKVAILLFVKNKDLTNIIKEILSETTKHKYFVRYKGNRKETSFSYIFSLPQDAQKEVYLEVLLFHYDKN